MSVGSDEEICRFIEERQRDQGRLYLFLWFLGSENVLTGMMSRMPFSSYILLVIMR